MRDWLPPKPPRPNPAWVVVSVVAHAVVLGGLLLLSGHTIRDRSRSYIVAPRTLPGPVVYLDMPYVPAGGGGSGQPAGTGARRAPPPTPPAGGAAPGGGAPLAVARDTTAPPALPGTGTGAGEGKRRLRAEYGDGRVWVRPWDAIAAAIAGGGVEDTTVDAQTHIARIDSAITARITAFLDTLSPDSMATAMPKPWVTEIAGQKWGIDQGWIYLGNLKLPTAILALLPLPQGNYEQAQRAADLQRIRLDIMQAARRAESADEFKKYVAETRKRRDAERQAKKSQQTKPDSTKS